MGGTAGLESIEGQGSTFWFTARVGVAERKHLDLQAQHDALKGLRVLVVDDNATNRRVLTGQLAACGIEPVCVSTAQDALQELVDATVSNQPFQVALLDFHMPECDGEQLGRLIRTYDHLDSYATRAARRRPAIAATRSVSRISASRVISSSRSPAAISRRVCRSSCPTARSRGSDARSRSSRAIRCVPCASRPASRRILLAEDNPVNQKVARMVLEKLGIEVTVVNNGREAVTAWRAGGHDLILMDCQMPELDGYEATREIRRAEQGAGSRPRPAAPKIPIVALTAHAMKGDDEKCRAAGMTDYLTKPLDRNKLQACLERHLGKLGDGTLDPEVDMNAGDRT